MMADQIVKETMMEFLETASSPNIFNSTVGFYEPDQNTIRSSFSLRKKVGIFPLTS